VGTLLNILGVSFLTFISRISGLVRDIFIFSAFGTSELNSAFLFAFSIPNLFRRLLGEGALASALIPIFSDEYHKKGKEEAFFLLNRVASRLILALFLIVGGGVMICGLGYVSGWFSDRWRLCFMFSAILLPYMFFACLGALLAAVLNVFGKFLLHAGNSIWLNLAMISALMVGYFFHESWRIYWLCAGVFVGGVIQLWVLWVGLGRMGWRFCLDWGSDGRVEEVRRLFFPGVAGASVQQVNVVISRALAYAVSSRAVSVLYLANRLIELPLGLFVTAVSTVLFPRLSRLEAQGERELLREEFRRGMDWVLVIIFPAALGILGLDRTLLSLLFLWGNFTERDLDLVLPVLRIFLVALPFYALSTHFLRGYHCKKNMARPMVIAAIHFLVNTFLALGLMFWLETVGLAIANLLSIILQTILLYWGLGRLGEEFCIKIWTGRLGRIILASISMAVVVKSLDYVLGLYLRGKAHDMVSMVVNIPLGVAFYFGLLYIFDGRKQLSDLGIIWRRFVKKIKNPKRGKI
jgi:putative peptidoglycan lipid II flippase